MPQKARLWLGVTLVVAMLYAVRATFQSIPPEDHAALSIVLCMLLTQVWFALDKTSLNISLSANRCWLRHYRMGKRQERSLPASNIHSARLEYAPKPPDSEDSYARIVLVTSLGMIPVSEQFQRDPLPLDYACARINRFLDTQSDYLYA